MELGTLRDGSLFAGTRVGLCHPVPSWSCESGPTTRAIEPDSSVDLDDNPSLCGTLHVRGPGVRFQGAVGEVY